MPKTSPRPRSRPEDVADSSTGKQGAPVDERSFDPHFGGPLDRMLTYRLHVLHKLSDRDSQQAYQDELGLPIGEGRCLASIGAFAPLSINDLARRTSLDKAQASRAAGSLVSRGLVARRASSHDGRGVVLSLTPEGSRAWRRTMALIARRNREIFGGLSEDERRLFSDLMDRLIGGIEPDPA